MVQKSADLFHSVQPLTCINYSSILNRINEARLLDQPGADEVLSESDTFRGASDGHFAVRGAVLSIGDLDVGT